MRRARLAHTHSGKLAALWALVQLKVLVSRILLLLMVRAEPLALSQRLCGLMLGRARHRAALARPRQVSPAQRTRWWWQYGLRRRSGAASA